MACLASQLLGQGTRGPCGAATGLVLPRRPGLAVSPLAVLISWVFLEAKCCLVVRRQMAASGGEAGWQ